MIGSLIRFYKSKFEYLTMNGHWIPMCWGDREIAYMKKEIEQKFHVRVYHNSEKGLVCAMRRSQRNRKKAYEKWEERDGDFFTIPMFFALSAL